MDEPAVRCRRSAGSDPLIRCKRTGDGVSLPSEEEQWRPVVGFEGFYEVSDHGRVRSLPRKMVDSRGRNRSFRGRILSPARQPRDGRLWVYLSVEGVVTFHYVHTLVLQAFVGPRPPGLWGLHTDGDAANNR